MRRVIVLVLVASCAAPLGCSKEPVRVSDPPDVDGAMEQLTAGRRHEDEDRDDEARACYERAVQLAPALAAAWVARANLLYRTGRRDAAIEDYGRALALDPSDAKVWYWRGYAHEAARAYDDALADYTAAIERDPEYAAAWMSRSVVRSIKGDRDGARADRAEHARLIAASHSPR